MALASGLFARSHVARDSGAPGHFCVCSTRVVGAVDDAILLSRWAARLPSLDDARVVVRLRDRLGALPCIDSIAVEKLARSSMRWRSLRATIGALHRIARNVNQAHSGSRSARK